MKVNFKSQIENIFFSIGFGTLSRPHEVVSQIKQVTSHGHVRNGGSSWYNRRWARLIYKCIEAVLNWWVQAGPASWSDVLVDNVVLFSVEVLEYIYCFMC